jgi:hypothetical protein
MGRANDCNRDTRVIRPEILNVYFQEAEHIISVESLESTIELHPQTHWFGLILPSGAVASHGWMVE